jgi:hypothetical protein
VVQRRVILGDREIAGQPRLGGEEIVVRRIGRVGAGGEADGEELPLVVEEDPEVHLHGVLIGPLGDGLEATQHVGGGR